MKHLELYNILRRSNYKDRQKLINAFGAMHVRFILNRNSEDFNVLIYYKYCLFMFNFGSNTFYVETLDELGFSNKHPFSFDTLFDVIIWFNHSSIEKVLFSLI